MIHQNELHFSTSGHGDMHDLTDQLQNIVKQSKIRLGTAHVFAVGSTAGIGAIEFEPGLQKDFPNVLNRLIPPSRNYAHEQAWHDGNGHSHLQATLLGPDLTIPVRDGRIIVGTWQQIVHMEFDVRARERQVIVTVMGE